MTTIIWRTQKWKKLYYICWCFAESFLSSSLTVHVFYIFGFISLEKFLYLFLLSPRWHIILVFNNVRMPWFPFHSRKIFLLGRGFWVDSSFLPILEKYCAFSFGLYFFWRKISLVLIVFPLCHLGYHFRSLMMIYLGRMGIFRCDVSSAS